MSTTEDKHYYVATYKEIFIGFVTFILILIVLYPKEMLHEQILSEEANYDLSMLYLKNMLANDPSNEILMFNLAKQSLHGNKRDLAYRLLKLLKKSKNPEIRQKAYRLSYTIAKEDYFYLLKDHKERAAKKLLKELTALNRLIVLNHYYKNNELQKLYEEALFLQNKPLAYQLLQKLLQKEPQNLYYLQSQYYLALDLHHYETALQLSKKLAELDSYNEEKWKESQYFLLYQYISKARAQEFLEQEARNSNEWLEKLAQFQLAHKQYRASSHSYMQLFQRSKEYKKRLHYWLEAMKILQQGGYLNEATKLANRYQDRFLQNQQVRIYLLKLYLANNDAKSANRLAKKILQLKLKR